MNQNADVICAGIIVADHVAAPVDHLPAAGELVLTDECFLSLGGCAANVAVDLAKLRIATNVCCCVGADSFGDFAIASLKSQGLDTSGIRAIEGIATSQTLIVNVKGQDRRFIHHLGANRVFSGAHLPHDQIAKAKVLYVGGYFLMEQFTPEELAEAFASARSAGVRTVLDVVTPGPGAYEEALRKVLPHTDVFLPNTDEAKLMIGVADPVEQARTLHAMGAGTVVITLGGGGAILFSREKKLRAGTYAVSFVDGTGGGDAFDAGYIAGLLEGATPERCLELGSALGASCVRRSGATAGVFERAELDAFLRDAKLSIETID